MIKDIEETLRAYPEILCGVSRIDFSEYKADYRRALIIAVPHARRTGIRDYKEAEFEALIREARERSISIVNEIAGVLSRSSVSYYIPAPAQTSEEELIAPFSFKYAAVNAGLGWIGKNDVLITEKYGPEVTLNALLIDYDLPAGEPVTESKCPPGCDLCVGACPYHALPGNLWNGNSMRSELIDYQLCNRKRCLLKETLGRKHSCGLCMAACPVGR